jgi:hypothetical protein
MYWKRLEKNQSRVNQCTTPECPRTDLKNRKISHNIGYIEHLPSTSSECSHHTYTLSSVQAHVYQAPIGSVIDLAVS